EGREAARRRALQQRDVEQVQSEPEPNGVHRTNDLGRNDGAVFWDPRRPGPQPAHCAETRSIRARLRGVSGETTTSADRSLAFSYVRQRRELDLWEQPQLKLPPLPSAFPSARTAIRCRHAAIRQKGCRPNRRPRTLLPRTQTR